MNRLPEFLSVVGSKAVPHSRKLHAAKGLAKRRAILSMLSDGYSIPAISEKLGIGVRMIGTHLSKALALESKYGSDLTAEQASQLRSIEAERLDKADLKCTVALNRMVQDSVDAGATHEQRAQSAMAVASLHRSLVSSSSARTLLLGIGVPSKSVQEMWQFRVNRNEEKREIVIRFDSSPLSGPVEVPPSVQMFSGGVELTNSAATELIRPDPPFADARMTLPPGSIEVSAVTTRVAEPEPAAATKRSAS